MLNEIKNSDSNDIREAWEANFGGRDVNKQIKVGQSFLGGWIDEQNKR